jgi:hypothetical protein
MAQYVEKIVGADGGFPEYRHSRDEMIRPVIHTLGDQPEGVDDQPVYPVHVEPPPPEEPVKAKKPEDHKAKAPEEHHKAKTPEDASKHPTG